MQLIEIERPFHCRHNHIFHPNPAIDSSIQTWFNRQDFASKDFGTMIIEQDRFMDLEADPVTGSMLNRRMIGDLASTERKAMFPQNARRGLMDRIASRSNLQSRRCGGFRSDDCTMHL